MSAASRLVTVIVRLGMQIADRWLLHKPPSDEIRREFFGMSYSLHSRATRFQINVGRLEIQPQLYHDSAKNFVGFEHDSSSGYRLSGICLGFRDGAAVELDFRRHSPHS